MFRVCKSFRFEAAHQLDCAVSQEAVDTIHGHSYRVELFLTSTCLDGNQMVADLACFAEGITHIQEMWDHGLLLSRKLLKKYTDIPCKNVVMFPVSPTAEVMSQMVFDYFAHVNMTATNGFRVEKVRVHETDTSWAEFEPPNALTDTVRQLCTRIEELEKWQADEDTSRLEASERGD